MKQTLFTLAAAALLVTTLPVHANVAPPAGMPGTAQVRRELQSYFANIGQNSPTVLGGLAQSPETLAAIQKRIAGMSDHELRAFQTLMAQTPDWKVAPEAIASAFPPEMLDQVKRVANDVQARIPRGKEMREDVQTLVTVLKLLPDAKLKELGVSREMVKSLDATFEQMNPLQAAMLQKQAETWQATGAAAMSAIPPAVQRGAAALAAHGPLTEKDVAELKSFRKELVGLLDRIDKLPPEMRKTLQTEQLRGQVERLGVATPDELFMVRHNVPPEMLQSLQASVDFLDHFANLSNDEKRDLETFRGDLTSAFRPLEQSGSEGEGSKNFEKMFAALRPEQLAVLQKGMEGIGDWKTALPVFYQTITSPDVVNRAKQLQVATPDPAVVQSLEAFRQQTLTRVAAAGQAGASAVLVEHARSAVQSASLPRLELMRAAVQSLPANASPNGLLSVAAAFNFNCSLDLGSLGTFSLDFICDPIESALNSVQTAVTNAVNATISGVQSALQSAINAATNALNSAISAVTNTVNSIVSSIQSVTNTIFSFVKTIPDLAWGVIKGALNSLLDIQIKNGVTLRSLVAEGVQSALQSMTTLIGLSGNWWTAISTFTIPEIPCPPANFHTPFGDTGTRAASDNYNRYKLLIDKIVDIIPDTEISLAIKIPAKMLYISFDFLGECLAQAADKADADQLTERHGIVLGKFADLQTFIGNAVGVQSNTSSSQTAQLLSFIATKSTNIQGLLVSQGTSTQTLIGTKSNFIQSLLTTRSNALEHLLNSQSQETNSDIDAFDDLNLRLVIERVLQRGGGEKDVASLKLLEPLGHLRLVSDVVRDTISNMGAAGQKMGDAQSKYDKGVTLMNAGSEKDAFSQFVAAYHAAVQ